MYLCLISNVDNVLCDSKFRTEYALVVGELRRARAAERVAAGHQHVGPVLGDAYLTLEGAGDPRIPLQSLGKLLPE